jgi:hypothetical protein
MSGPDYLAMLRAKKLEGDHNPDSAKTERPTFCTLCSSPKAYLNSTSPDKRQCEYTCSAHTNDWWLVYLDSSPDPVVITASRPSDESMILAAHQGRATKVERTIPQLQKLQKVLTDKEMERLRGWMKNVDINEPTEIDRIIHSCAMDMRERELILGWADGR